MTNKSLISLIAAALLVPSTASLAKDTQIARPEENQIIYDVVSGQVRSHHFSHIPPTFSEGLVEFVVANECYGNIGPTVNSHTKGSVTSTHVLNVEDKTVGFEKKRHLERVTITANDSGTLIAASYLFDAFGNPNFDGMTCELLGKLFTIGHYTPIEFDNLDAHIKLTEDLDAPGIVYEVAFRDLEDLNKEPLFTVNQFEFKYILDESKVTSSGADGHIIDVAPGRWRAATAYEQLQIYRNFLMTFHTHEADKILPTLFGIDQTDLVALNPGLGSQTTTFSVDLDAVAQRETITPQGPVDTWEPETLVIPLVVEEPTQTYIAPEPVVVEEPTQTYIAPEPVVVEEPTQTYIAPEPVVVEEPTQTYIAPEPVVMEEPTLAEQQAPIYIAQEAEQQSAISIAFTPTQEGNGLLNICGPRESYELADLRASYSGVDELLTSAFPSTAATQTSLYLVATGENQGDLEVVVCNGPNHLTPAGTGTLTPKY